MADVEVDPEGVAEQRIRSEQGGVDRLEPTGLALRFRALQVRRVEGSHEFVLVPAEHLVALLDDHVVLLVVVEEGPLARARDEERTLQALRRLREHLERLRLAPDHHGSGALYHAGLLRRNQLQRIPETAAVVEPDLGDHTQHRVLDDVGGVQFPAQSNLTNHHINVRYYYIIEKKKK